MQPVSENGSLDSGILLDLPKESLVSIIRQMSGQLSELRSKITVLEQRNCMLQDGLPELVRGTIHSAMSMEGGAAKVDCYQVNLKNDEAATAGTISESGGTAGLLSLSSALPLLSSMSPESSAVLKFLNSILHSSPSLPTAKAPSSVLPQLPIVTPPSTAASNLTKSDELTGTETQDVVKLTPLPPLSFLEEEADEGDDYFASVGTRPRRSRTRTETTSLLSEEVTQQIEAQILLTMTERRERFWQIFLESKGWTRATCALMSCLFTRWQMAHSTVYGRQSPVGGEARDRLPTRLVQFIVTKINQRFGVNPVKVRARMAQKCKDLRRLMRKYGEDAVALEGVASTAIAANEGREVDDIKSHNFDHDTEDHMAVSFVPLHSSVSSLPNVTFPPTS